MVAICHSDNRQACYYKLQRMINKSSISTF
jgi:hypothetical protein